MNLPLRLFSSRQDTSLFPLCLLTYSADLSLQERNKLLLTFFAFLYWAVYHAVTQTIVRPIRACAGKTSRF